ncbi:MAG: type II CRISPR RNA-guided endonuclease Cas9, partial [bacterium]
LEEEISLLELGRIFYHFIQRRGFLSNRIGSNDGAIFKGKENMTGINETREQIKNETLGKFLYDISFKEGEKYYLKKDAEGKEIRVRARYTQRDMYISEFQNIWNKQADILKLKDKKIRTSKTRYLKGNINNNRNKAKIAHYINEYGKENVIIENNKVTTYSEVPLKEFFAGEIYYKDGNLRFKSNESLLFWQRPLRSQKNLLDNCRFENELPVIMGNGKFRKKNGEVIKRSKKPCPLSHPEFELFRAHQFINNIKFGKGNRLNEEQRQIILELINSKDAGFKFDQIPKKLNLTYEKFNYDNDQKIAGNPTIKKLKPLFSAEIWEKHYEEIWHCFYFYDDNDLLFEKLKKDFNLKTDSVEKISNIKLKEGYSNVSLKAIRNILPFLENGHQYDRAVILGGVKNAFSDRWDDFSEFHEQIEKDVIQILKEENTDGSAIEKIKDYLSEPSNFYGFYKNDPYFSHLYHHSQDIEKKNKTKILPEVENLRNPIVQQALNETRRLVNSLLAHYRRDDPDFSFERIHVEMGRNLKNNKTKRQELSRRISDNEKKNEAARERLAEFGLRPSRENVQRYLLFDEIQKHVSGPVQCPYTGKVINLNDLLGGENLVQIEHMIPFSVSLDDSFGNKTLCESNFNRLKGERTPYEYYEMNPDPKLWGTDSWDAVSERAFKILPYYKAKRFTAKKKFEKSQFIERQLNDSRYISKKAVELLSAICDDVKMLPGQVTSELRHLWGINNILNPVHGIENLNAEVKEEERHYYYVVTDENDKAISLQRKENEKPETDENQITITGDVKNGKFFSKYLSIKVETPELKDGKYWIILNVSEPHSFQPVFVSKPDADEDEVIFKGRIENHFFNNDTIGKRIKTDNEDGSYWAKFSIKNKEFKRAETKGRIKTTGSKVALFGSIEDGTFSSHIYQCKTNLPDGKYWSILELDFDNVEFLHAVKPRPETNEEQVLSYATVDEDGLMVADIDPSYTKNTQLNSGRYYCLFDVDSIKKEKYRVENDPPELKKGEKLTEANVWVDEATGEIKYDPKKNREDHRHHAIDAITVALTEQGFLQRLSTHHALEKEKQRGINSTEKFPEPWNGFNQDVQKAADAILVSHKKNSKVLTKVSKKIIKDGKTYLSKGYEARGQLHKEFVFGNRKPQNQKEGFHIRKPISDIKTNKHINKVVDPAIRDLILNHLKDNCGVDISKSSFSVPKDAFFIDGEPRVFLPNRKGGEPVPVKKVRLRENIGNAVNLKSERNQFVNPRNNHHVLIYKDEEENYHEDVVTFWTVTERQLQNQSKYQMPEDGKEIVTTLEINDMFLLGLSDEEYESNKNNEQLLCKHLYRVQKFTSGDYYFRYHMASTIDHPQEKQQINSFGDGKNGWLTHNPIKVKINILGNIEKI